MEVVDSRDGILRLEGEVAASPADVFRHFTEPALLQSWWAEEAETDARVGGTYRFSWPSHEWVLSGDYLAVEPGQRLTFTWAFDHEDLEPSTVDLEFQPSETGTHLVIEHSHGREGAERDEYEEGWKTFIERLREVLRDGAVERAGR